MNQNDFEKEYSDKVYKWRKRHKKCLFCRYLKYRDLPLGSYYICKAKNKIIEVPEMRRICRLFELDINE